jgi:hypothetical protein
LTHYPGGQTLPTPKKTDFVPGHLLGSVSGELGLRKFIESQGYELIVTADKDGPNSVFERELPDAETPPFAKAASTTMEASRMRFARCSRPRRRSIPNGLLPKMRAVPLATAAAPRTE